MKYISYFCSSISTCRECANGLCFVDTPEDRETAGLLGDEHTVVVDNLPASVSPCRMKNKLTIHFQSKHNGGGEVVDVTYPTTRPDQAYVTFRDARGIALPWT